MSTTETRFVDTVRWEDLQHAYGSASDVPQLLEKVTASRGQKLYQALDELCSRVLHQGTIYSASPPVVRVVIEMLPDAAPKEQVMFYGLLSGFAASARMAIDDGPAPPSCAGGTPEDGVAIRQHLLAARSLFASVLVGSNDQIRTDAAAILSFVADQDAATAKLLRDRYLVEDESLVRHTLLTGLTRARNSFDDWPVFLIAALEREREASNRVLLRCAQIHELPSATDSACVDDMVSSFVEAHDPLEYQLGDEEPFFEALHLLGRDRELAALLKAFDQAKNHDALRVLATRILRLVFDDQRTGWGNTSRSRMNEDGSRPPQASISSMALRTVGTLILFKLFPFVMRWRMRRSMRRKPKGIRKIDYWGLQSPAPEIPQKLNEAQRIVLTAFVAKAELWQFRTNLWELFGLPDDAAGLGRFVAGR
jgi:hypothetical protein